MTETNRWSIADRDGDIEFLAWHFIDEFAAESARNIEGISDEAMEAMRDYEWPGNVHELRNVVRHAHIVGTGEILELSDLTPGLRGEPPPNQSPEKMSETELERRRLVEALNEADEKNKRPPNFWT